MSRGKSSYRRKSSKKGSVGSILAAVLILVVLFVLNQMGLVELPFDFGANEQGQEQGTEQQSVDIGNIPAFSGYACVVLNDNIPAFTDEEKTVAYYEAFDLEHYGELDSLGRCTAAYAAVCRETMPTEKRDFTLKTKPSGWINVKYDTSLVDGGWLYNRCHLIGWQLTAEADNELNLITGTRYLNVTGDSDPDDGKIEGGMLTFENMVADYVKETGNHVAYRVTPIFEGDNLLASGVQMEGWSIEDNGEGICFNVFCYNVQPGIVLDYATGESRLAE